MSPPVHAAPVLHVEVAGDAGPCIVLHHGFSGSARNWRPQVRALRSRARVVTYDARGHARSAADSRVRKAALPEGSARDGSGTATEELADDARATNGFALDDFTRDFADVASEHAGSEPIIAGGLSLGAAVALHHALASPGRVRGLVLAAFPAGAGEGRGFAPEARDFADALEREGVEAAGARFVWGEQSGLDPGAAKFVRAGFLEHPPDLLAAILRQTIAVLPSVATLAPRLAQLDIPALVVVGRADASSLGSCRALAEALPKARLVEIENAGHVVNLAQPRHFNAALLEFLGELESGAGYDAGDLL